MASALLSSSSSRATTTTAILIAIYAVALFTIASSPISVEASKQQHLNTHAEHAHAKLLALKDRVATQADVTYEWQTGTWSDCTATCGYGHKTRSVVCYSSAGEAVDDSLCDSSDQPSATETCIDTACASWTYGSWSDCSASCGAGTQTRSVTCVDLSGSTVDDSECTGSAPSASQNCDIEDCETDTWSWSVGGWSDCSATCGEGVQTRTRSCMNEDGEVSSDPETDCGDSTFVSSKTCDEAECSDAASVNTATDTTSVTLSTGDVIDTTSSTGSDDESSTSTSSTESETSTATSSSDSSASSAAPSFVVAAAALVAAALAL